MPRRWAWREGNGRRAGANKLGGLSHREREVLQLVAGGRTNRQSADRFFASRRTVETYRQNLLKKTEFKNTLALLKYAMEQELRRA